MLASRCHAALPVLVLVGLALAGCSSDDSARLGELEPIPHPDTEGLDDGVREGLVAARVELDKGLALEGITATQRAGVYGHAGMVYHAQAAAASATACYRNAQRLEPDRFQWPYYLGQVHRAEGEIDLAVQNLSRAVTLEPRSVVALIHLAQLEYERQRYDAARTLFDQARQVTPDSAAALVGLGKIAAVGEQPAEAVRLLERALELAPDATEIHYPLGLAYRALGDRDKALAYLARRGNRGVSVEDPLMADIEALAAGWRIHHNRGTDLFEAGLFERALAEFRTAAERAPDESVLQINLGSTLSKLGDLAGARAAFEKALANDPDNDTAQFNLGILAARTGDDAAAVDHYGAALRINDDLIGGHFNLGNALRRLGRFDESLSHYRRVTQADPGNGGARLAEVYALIRLARYREALERAEEGVLVVPDDRRLRHAVSRLLSASPVPAIRDGRRALELAEGLLAEESSLSHAVALAMAAAEVGDFDLAVQWQDRAVKAVEGAQSVQHLLPGYREDLEAYRRGEPCRKPWRDDEPELSPRSQRRAGG